MFVVTESVFTFYQIKVFKSDIPERFPRNLNKKSECEMDYQQKVGFYRLLGLIAPSESWGTVTGLHKFV